MGVEVEQEGTSPTLTALGVWGQQLRTQLEEQLRQRDPIERRWVEDIRQYHGNTYYDGGLQTEKDKDAITGGKCGFNRTRTKVNTGTGRLADLLFPADDKNWTIKPSPVPELIQRLGDETPATWQGQQINGPDGQPVTEGAVAAREMEIAKECAGSMEKEIDDQLKACHYGAEARRALFYSGLLGTGVIKGPIVEGQTRKAWAKDANGIHQLSMRLDRKPAARCVAPWDFVPDMSAARMSQAEFVFERIYVPRSGMKRLQAKFGFSQEGYECVMRMSPSESFVMPTQSLNELRGLAGLQAITQETRYEIWLYHGPVSSELLRAIGAVLPHEKEEEIEEFYPSVVWFCGGYVIKAAVSPLDTGELPYSVFAWQEDETCIFGYGVPYLTRNSQNTINRAWDAMLGNAEISAGSQIVARKGIVEPANGQWEIKPNKIWYATNKVGEAKHAFETYEIPNHQPELAALVQDASSAMDEESLIPVLQQGEQGTAGPTLGGMAMLMNASLTTVRQQVKRWDDEVTVPTIGRFYDWNMLNSKKNEIKGDYEVEATGSSSLLVREIVGAELRTILTEAANNPVLANWTKFENLYAQYIRTTHIKPEEAIRTKEEFDAFMKNQQTGPTPEQLDHEWRMAQLAIKQQENQVLVEKIQSEERVALHKLRLQQLISEQEYQAEIEKVDKKARVELYMFQNEMKLKLAGSTGI